MIPGRWSIVDLLLRYGEILGCVKIVNVFMEIIDGFDI